MVGWVPGSFWTGVENLAPTEIRSSVRQARSKSLYRPSYRGPHVSLYCKERTESLFLSLEERLEISFCLKNVKTFIYCTICYDVPNKIQRNRTCETLVLTLGYTLDWSSCRTSSVEQHYVVQWTRNEVLEEHDSSIFRARHFKIIYLGLCSDWAL